MVWGSCFATRNSRSGCSMWDGPHSHAGANGHTRTDRDSRPNVYSHPVYRCPD